MACAERARPDTRQGPGARRMTSWDIKGWCPGALRPMQSGDGLLVRIRPPAGRLSPSQARAIARAAARHGNGIIDLSARANLQLRGVGEANHAPLIDDLRAHGLIDPDIQTESLRNLIVTPFRDSPPIFPRIDLGGREAFPIGRSATPGAERHTPPSHKHASHAPTSTDALADSLARALARMPPLPGKFGFTLDAGARPVLATASADIRVERSVDGRLILRPDGYALGKPVTDLATDAIAMAEWFLAQGGVTHGRGRMAALIARGIIPDGCDAVPADRLANPSPGLHPTGVLVALAFGQMRAETVHALADLGHELRPTPWRMLFIAGATRIPDVPGVICDPDDPLLRVTACSGSPGCPQALGETRSLARSLAASLSPKQNLHVSGCAKGCAHPAAAGLTLVATGQGYDLVLNGRASDTPSRRGLTPAAIPDLLKAFHAPSL